MPPRTERPLTEPAYLITPSPEVRESYLAGERADCLHRGTDTDWLVAAEADFDGFTAARQGLLVRWGVPFTMFWFVSGRHYIGTLALRHRLTPELEQEGGHIGYHVVAPWHRQGHATRMLHLGLREARRVGLDRALLSCTPDNEWSRRVILANGGVPAERLRDEDRFWVDLSSSAGEPAFA
jgi:predicted acetyltransferase